jgi:hypothetical protein
MSACLGVGLHRIDAATGAGTRSKNFLICDGYRHAPLKPLIRSRHGSSLAEAQAIVGAALAVPMQQPKMPPRTDLQERR